MTARARQRRNRHAPDSGAPLSCIIYARQSQDRSGEQLAVERQLARCRELAAQLGLQVEREYIDNDASATSGKRRPEFEAMIAAKPPAIISWHQDRLLRLTSDLEKVIQLGIPAYFVEAAQVGGLDLSTPAGRAVARTVAAWSQYEGEQKALRQVEKNIQSVEAGAWLFSRPPFGYRRVDGKIQQVPGEAEVIRDGYLRCIKGASYREVAAVWNEKGITRMGGGSWRAVQVQRLLSNARYAGIVVDYGEEVFLDDGSRPTPQWEPIITQREWADFQAVRSGRKRKGAPTAGKPQHLLSGLLTCGKCGGKLYATPSTRPKAVRPETTAKRPGPYLVYACYDKRCTSINYYALNDAVEALVLQRIRDPKVLRGLRRAPNTTPLIEEIEERRQARQSIQLNIAKRLTTNAEAAPALELLTAEIEERQRRLDALTTETPLSDFAAKGAVKPKWQAMDLIAKRRTIAELMDRIVINRGKPGPPPKGPDGQRIVDLDRVAVEWSK